MGYPLLQSQTAQPLIFFMADSSDHVTGKTGLSPTVTLSKNGGSFASPSGAVSEIAHGWYKVAGNATDSNTLGPLLLHATGSGADPVDDCFPVVAYDMQSAVRLGLTALPNVASGSSGAIITHGTGTAQLKCTSGYVSPTWADIASPTTTVNLSGTTVKTATDVETDTQDIQSRLPAALTGDGNMKADALRINGVATTSVTTINANVGTTQPINFTGTGATAYSKVDVTQWLTVAPLALSSQQVQAIVPDTQKVDVNTIKTQTVTCAAGVTVGAFVGQGTAAIGVNASGHVSRVVLVDTTTTNTDMRGTDNAALAATALSTVNWTTARAGHLDNINNAALATTAAQTGDSFARLGAPAGASVSADVAAVKTDTGNLVTRITSTLFTGITSLAQWLGLIAGKQVGNSTARTELRATGAGSGTFDETTDSAEAIRDRGDTAWITATGFSTLDAAGVRTAVGLASANLDTQLDAIPTNSELATAIITGLTTALTEGYRGTGATGSVRDLLYEIIAHLGESSISGTTKTLKKLNGSTTAKTYTLDSATTPTSITETT